MDGPRDACSTVGAGAGVDRGNGSNDSVMQRTRSNISSTSTSSDIQVAAPPSASPSFTTMTDHQRPRLARVENRRMLIVNLRALSSVPTRHVFNTQDNTNGSSRANQPHSGNINDGRNDRGTYSREYAQQHPEIEWVHRGQGRYLPADEVRPVPVMVRQAARFVPPENSLLRRLALQTTEVQSRAAESREPLWESTFKMAVDYNTPTGAPHLVGSRLGVRPVPPAAAAIVAEEGERSDDRYLSTADILARVDEIDRQAAAQTLLDLGNPSYIPTNRSRRASRGPLNMGMDGTIDTGDEDVNVGSTHPPLKRASTSTSLQVPRKRRGVDEMLSDSLSGVPVYGLRHRRSETQTDSTKDSRPVRSARRTSTFPILKEESPKSSRIRPISYHEHSADESDDDSTEEDGAKGRTYRREYVDAHPELAFHHTGNGWYKLGERPQRGNKFLKQRRSIDVASAKSDNRKHSLDLGGTIHSDELSRFPGQEFHHTGNSWYRAGPDPAGKRTSVVVPAESDDVEQHEDVNGTVSKEYKEAHPEIEWVHRGNGRYKRKAKVITDDPFDRVVSLLERVGDRILEERASKNGTFDKAYVLAHPNEEFYHTGNARYKRGRKPVTSATSRADSEPEEEAEEEGESGTLFDKAYVEAHPDQEFHHRGQGRYARGPRPTSLALRVKSEPEPDDGEYYSEMLVDDNDEMYALVDSDYVDAHPDQTFHHRGQGRWARGLPPPGSSRKMAVRGPNAKDKDKHAAQLMEEEEEVQETPPVLTALVSKAEGPERWPDIEWHYRGGGKWGRLTKGAWEKILHGSKGTAAGAMAKAFGRNKSRRSTGGGPESQLSKRTSSGALAGDVEQDDPIDMADGVDEDGVPVIKKKIKRRGRGSLRAQTDVNGGDQDLSNPQSKAPSPKLPMLTQEEEETEFHELNGISIYNDKWSPPTGEETQLERYYRKNFDSLNTDKLYSVITKYDPGQRSLDHAKRILEKLQIEMLKIEDEYHELDRITAPKQKVPRKPTKGRAVPVDPQIFEDKKEADLYGYHFDPRKIGQQDPEAQRIVLDAEGRELRKRRNRTGVELNGITQIGDGEEVPTKRASRQPNRFDNVIEPTRKRQRNNLIGKATSLTPDRYTPQNLINGYQVPTTGRWAGHVPKRIRELRDESVVTVRSEGGTVTHIRKGRPPGSRNRQVRKDAGIKKGPRKPKTAAAAAEDDSNLGIDGGDEEDDMDSGEEA